MSKSFRLLLLRRRFFARFELADSLRHRSHRAEGAPRARHIGRHDDYAEERRRQHEAVEPESKLRDPIGEEPDANAQSQGTRIVQKSVIASRSEFAPAAT